eukprot:10383060-Prorocentrum_lima.AAC.1
MTSSLVGSEMCIRDSGESTSTQNVYIGLLRMILSLTYGRVETITTTAVSYTHMTLPTICSV